MKIFVRDHNSVLKDLKDDFELVGIDQAERVVLWNDVLPMERGIIQYAKSRGVPTIVMQHGRRGTSRYYPPFNEKIQADKLLVWGENDKKALIEAGQEPSKIRVTGTTVLSNLPKAYPANELGRTEGLTIVFSPEHWDGPIKENTRVRDELRKLDTPFPITTKIIDSPSHQGIEWDNPLLTKRSDLNHLDVCKELLTRAMVVVGVSESTLELMAQAMGIPVVIAEDWEPKPSGGDMRYLTYRRVISPASKRAKLHELNEVILSQIYGGHNDLKKEREEIAILDGGINLNARELIRQEIINV